MCDLSVICVNIILMAVAYCYAVSSLNRACMAYWFSIGGRGAVAPNQEVGAPCTLPTPTLTTVDRNKANNEDILLMKNKHIVIRQSERCKFMPTMHQNTFGAPKSAGGA